MRPPAFWQHGGWPARALAPAGALVDRGTALRRSRTAAWHPGVPVICVGNVTLGGAGKTPVALDLGARLAASGRRVHFLARGYGGRRANAPQRVDPTKDDAADVGDEPLLLAAVAPTWVGADRAASAAAAVAAGAEVLVLDDGFQSARVRADANLVVVDGTVGYGNGRVLPAGPLRERPERALARTDVLVRLGPDAQGVDATCPSEVQLRAGHLEPAAETDWLRGSRVIAFAGIGRPAKFFAMVRAAGADVVETVAFPDHHRYTDREMAELAARADRAGARLVTTAKDHVRLATAARARVTPVPVRVTWAEPESVTAFLTGLTHRDQT